MEKWVKIVVFPCEVKVTARTGVGTSVTARLHRGAPAKDASRTARWRHAHFLWSVFNRINAADAQ